MPFNKSISSVALFLCLIVNFCSVSSNAQDVEKIKEFVKEQFEPEVNISVVYSSKDFWTVQHLADPIDELSLDRIEELKDSLRITDNKFYLSKIGKLYGRMNQRAEALEYLYKSVEAHKQLLESDPDSLDAVIQLFSLYVELGESEKAIELSQRAIELNPADSTTTAFVSFLHMSNGNFDQAHEWADQSMDRFPQIPIGYLYKMMALVFEEMGVMQQSENFAELQSSYEGLKSDFSFLEEARQKFADDPEMQVGMLGCQLLVTFYEKAIPMMFDPIEDVTDFKIELTADDKSDLKEIRKKLNSILDSGEFGNLSTLYYSIGLADLMLAKYRSAIKNIETSISHMPLAYRDLQHHVAHHYDCVIGCYLILDDKVNAKKWSEQKIDDHASVDPQAMDHYYLALHHVMEEDLLGAKKILEQALAIDPESCEALVALANIYMLEENLPLAEEYLDEAYRINADYIGFASSLLLNRLFYNDLELVRFLVDNRLEYNPEDQFALDIQKEFLSE
jgi:tetratricopeptide (TPR) repeat protein